MSESVEKAQTKPGLVQIADVFTRYANFTLGGGSATVAVLHRELLDKRRWISSDDFTALVSRLPVLDARQVRTFWLF